MNKDDYAKYLRGNLRHLKAAQKSIELVDLGKFDCDNEFAEYLYQKWYVAAKYIDELAGNFDAELYGLSKEADDDDTEEEW